MFKNLIFTLVLMFAVSAQTVHATVYPYTENNKLTLMEDPKAASEFKLAMVRNARHHIHIMTYFWDDSVFPTKLAQELVKANERGVEIRILTTFFPSVSTDLTAKSKRLLRTENGKAVFTYIKLLPIDGITSTNNLHEKIFLVDGEKAILGGRNISDSSFHGKDMEVLLEGPVVNQVQDHFKSMHDFLVKVNTEYSCKRNYKKCKDFSDRLEKSNFSAKANAYFPVQPEFENGIKARILTHNGVLKQQKNRYSIRERAQMQDDIISSVVNAKFNKLRAYNYFIIPTTTYKNFLERSVEEGKDIQIITNGKRSAATVSDKGYLYSLPEMRELASKGLSIYQWQGKGELEYLHEKVMIFDDEHVIIGSHNFGRGSTSASNEIAIEFDSADIAKRLIDIFDNEISDETLTKKTKEHSILQEINDNFKLVKFLRTTIIGGILSELY